MNDLVKTDNNIFSAANMPNSMKVAEMLAKSTIVPAHFRDNVGNCMIALNFAARSGADPFMIMQSMYIIHGKPSLETKLIVALFNGCGKYSPIEYNYNNEKTECTATSTVLATRKKITGPTVSLQMAKDEGWFGKSGSKWKTMPEVMLAYRAAAFFIRRHAPEITFGMYTKDEIIDIHSSSVTTQVQQEVNENANKKLIDFPNTEKEPPPEWEKPTVEDVPVVAMATKEQYRTIIQLEKASGRTKDQTFQSISGFTAREIEKMSELTAEEAAAYIDAIGTEHAQNKDKEQEKPAWG